MAVLMIAKFKGSPSELKTAYDKSSKLLEEQTGSALPPGAVRHACALSDDALFVVDIWESEEVLRGTIESDQFEQMLTSQGFPSPRNAEIQILQVHATIPPL